MPLLAESLSQFIDRVAEVEKNWSPQTDVQGLWYRGHSKAWWSLTPKLYRLLGQDEDAREADDDFREDFIRRAPSLTVQRPENAWEWYFLMQHYRAPTRLLDWTEGALLALYFAVRDNDGFHDAAVWALDPWWLNHQHRVVAKWEVIPPGSRGLSKQDIRRYSPWLPGPFDSSRRLRKELPVAVYPNYIDRRIAAQRSCFTLHGTLRAGLEDLFGRTRDRLAKIIIPSYAVKRIRGELEVCGINDVAVFPDLEGLGRDVTGTVDSSRLPHEGVHTRLGPSKVHREGVGVFAIKRIRKGTFLFPDDNDELLWVSESELPKGQAQAPIRRLYEDFAVLRRARYGCPPSFNRLTVAWYLNEPKDGTKPNVRCDENYDFWALRNIDAGEELTVDYSTYSEAPRKGAARSLARRGRLRGLVRIRPDK